MHALLTLIEQRRELVDDKTRCTNRLGSMLKPYHPQVLQWFDKIDNLLVCGFLARWPTLPSAKRADRATLEEFFHDHNCRCSKIVDARVNAIRSSVALTKDAAIVAPGRPHVLALVEQLRMTLAAIKQFERQIEAIVQTIPDYQPSHALPGAGPHLAPHLLAAFGEQRERFTTAAALQMYAGIAPLTERNGNKR
ncbi:MAG TPA: transposase [Burkholderiaceae bacterium]|nr:transposase [Burkholderiaceae bacterium]